LSPGDFLGQLNGCFRFLEGLESPVGLLDPTGELRFANKAWLKEFGPRSDDPFEWLGRVASDDADHVRRSVEAALREQRSGEVDFSVSDSRNSHQTMSCALSPVRAEDGTFAGLTLICRDITERRRREQRLAFMAGHDPLTGLANRRTFEEELARAVSRAERGGRGVVMLLDMDHLKHYNDARGHLAGDQALVNMAMLLRTHVRASDLPARIGGDEFAVLLEDATMDEAFEIANRMGEAAREGGFVDGARDFSLGLSGGLAEVERGSDPVTILDRADVALYAAKSQGRDRMIRWTPSLGVTTSAGLLGSRLRYSLAERTLSLAFQPVVRLDDGSVSYYESLARLRDEDGGEHWPADFLPVAERLGLMGRLTRRVVELAVEQLAAHPDISLSVNLSQSDLVDARLMDDVEQAFTEHGVSPRRIVFEVSESAAMIQLPGMASLSERLSRLGSRLVLADFGTALGSFALLHEIPADEVKLSRSVIRALEDSDESRSFVRAVRELIESRGRVAVAAFVESEALLVDAREAGFTYGQGFQLAVPSEDLAALAREMRGFRA
jgi:diguanylate cyclase (GGDEF)-like protein/PAS domain S-box-containing protein